MDIFLGITAYSLQSHLRTTVSEIGQIEIDEVYVGVNRTGSQFIVPVQAKGEKDRIGMPRIAQDLAYCSEKFPSLIARSVAAQFMPDGTIAMFELGLQDHQIVVVEEKHYQLVAGSEISRDDLDYYVQHS